MMGNGAGNEPTRDILARIDERSGRIEATVTIHDGWLRDDPGVVPFIRNTKKFGFWIVGLLATVATAVVSSCVIDLQKSDDIEARLGSQQELFHLQLAEQQRVLEGVRGEARAARRAAEAGQVVITREVKKVAKEVGVPGSGAVPHEPRKRPWYERVLD